MSRKGVVNLHRKFLDHWLYTHDHTFSKMEAWVDIMLCANVTKGDPVILNGEKFVAERGQSLFSLETWAKRWRWDKSKVRRFLDKLQNDKMIVINNEKKTTRLTICNYDSYNGKRHSIDTASTPINNILSKDSINIRKEVFQKQLADFKEEYPRDMLVKFSNYWTEPTIGGMKMRFELEKTWETKRRLLTWSNNSKTKFSSLPKRDYNQPKDESENANLFGGGYNQ